MSHALYCFAGMAVFTFFLFPFLFPAGVSSLVSVVYVVELAKME